MTIYHPDTRRTVTVTVTTSTDGLSTGFWIGGERVLALVNTSTTWTNAAVSFLGATSSDATYRSIYGTTGNEISCVTTAGWANALTDDNAQQVSAFPWLKLLSGVNGTPVTQTTAARTFTVVLGKPE